MKSSHQSDQFSEGLMLLTGGSETGSHLNVVLKVGCSFWHGEFYLLASPSEAKFPYLQRWAFPQMNGDLG